LYTSIFKEFKAIYEDVISEATIDDGEHDNMQFNPNIAKKLLDFCKLIPCWSAIMVPIFKYGNITETSTTSESLFNDLKTNIFKHKTLPLRIEQFLKIHINSIIGLMNIIGCKLTATNSEIPLEENHLKNDITNVDHNADIDLNDNYEDYVTFVLIMLEKPVKQTL